MEVRMIPARPALAKPSADASNADVQKKLRVAAYCRVSTVYEEQESSYEAQITHYADVIRKNRGWTLAGIYADEGISGTNTKKREQFNRMIRDCEDHRIDLVITKSISRFARNTLDCLNYIRQLKMLDIPIYFEKENVNTMDEKGAILITIMASIAQQESQSISQNVRMGIQYRFQQGQPMLQHTWFLGYTKQRGGGLEIVPEEAEVVRRIYRDFLEGFSLGEIAQQLERDGILTGAGRKKWYTSTVRSMLQNEKYMGDLLLQKGYTADFLTKKKVKNTGALPQYYVEGAHAPIVPRDVFLQVQGEFLRREQVRLATGKREMRRSGLGLNKKVCCGVCGNTYRRAAKNDGRRETAWRCRNRGNRDDACAGRIVKEKDLHAAVVQSLNALPAYQDELRSMKSRLCGASRQEICGELRRVESMLRERETLRSEWTKTRCGAEMHDTNLQKEQAACASDPKGNDSGFSPKSAAKSQGQEQMWQWEEEIASLQMRQKELLCEKAHFDIQVVQIDALLDLIRQLTQQPEQQFSYAACRDYADFFALTHKKTHTGPVEHYCDEDVIRYIDHVKVLEDHLAVVFKAGIEMVV